MLTRFARILYITLEKNASSFHPPNNSPYLLTDSPMSATFEDLGRTRTDHAEEAYRRAGENPARDISTDKQLLFPLAWILYTTIMFPLACIIYITLDKFPSGFHPPNHPPPPTCYPLDQPMPATFGDLGRTRTHPEN